MSSTIRSRDMTSSNIRCVDMDPLLLRAHRAQRTVAEIDLDARLALAAQGRSALAAAGEEIVAMAVEEVGQPVRFARRELASALGLLDALPVLAEQIRSRPAPAPAGTKTTIAHAPYGVVLGWHAANSPVWVPTVVCASALVAGNAVLSRPSRRALRTTRLVIEALCAAWPTDAVQVVDVAPEVAESLVGHPGVGAVVTHASTETCRRQLLRLAEACAAGAPLRPFIPEASGNDALVVCDGADLRRAAGAIAVAGFANGGQLCMAAKRIIVERACWEELRPLLVAAVSALVCGEATDEATDIAPLPEGGARRQARAMLAEALAAGGRIIVGRGEEGRFVTPTVVELPPEGLGCRLWRDECFAPVRGLVVADDLCAARDLAADSRFGLGVGVYGPPEQAAELVAHLRVARVMINADPLAQDPHLVVGGVGDSGLGGARPKLEQLCFQRRVHEGWRSDRLDVAEAP